MAKAACEPQFQVKGPYKYDLDEWPCYRVVKDDYETFAVIFDNDGTGAARAERICSSLNETGEFPAQGEQAA